MFRLFSCLSLFFICAAVQAQTFETGFDAIRCGDTRIIFEKTCQTKQWGVSFVHVHENEKTAVQTALQMIDSLNKGCFVTWKAKDDRYVTFGMDAKTFKFDPNRIYTDKGLEATLRANGNFSNTAFKAVKKVADAFARRYIDSNTLVVAMHNNTEGGGLHIRSYLPGGDYARDALAVHVVDTEDIDDFFYTTEQRIYDYLKAKGFNILLQNNDTVTDDGSMSVYCGKINIAYLNIEAQHGSLQSQKRMMAAVFEMIDELYQ